ncbi:MAG: DNA repair protein RadA [Elusimicrobiota bacterium]
MKLAVKPKIVFRCQECGHSAVKWLGKCPDCRQWNSFVEEKEVSSPAFQRRVSNIPSAEAVEISSLKMDNYQRVSSGLTEFDRILGGGLVPSSFILIGGPPGIGKSTLLLQLASHLCLKEKVLYVSGEESLEQIKLRSDRLGLKGEKLYLLAETNLETIVVQIEKLSPKYLIIDSIQTVYRPDLPSAPGSVGQVRECANEFLTIAKGRQITTFVIGHVTKEGTIAGPRVLEHIVDTVVYFESEKHQSFRILRSYKNRFGPTQEVGLLEMAAEGLRCVDNPSKIFLQERVISEPGTTIVPVIEGTRPILLELQALVSLTNFGLPRRMVTGLDYNRAILLIAIIEKRLGLPLENKDVFLNVVGGIKIDEPAADLGVVFSVVSALNNRAFPMDTAVVGEVGLTGEVRAVTQIEQRVREAEKLGFARCIIPAVNNTGLANKTKIEIIGLKKVSEVLDWIK